MARWRGTLGSWGLVAWFALAAAAGADDPLPAAKPIPRMQVLPLPLEQAAITRDGVEISRYYFHPSLRRPYLYPLIGPSGKSLTRMGHPHDANGHSHHNSFWVSHHDVNGVTFWGDRGPKPPAGQIVHRRVIRYDDADDEALIEVENGWVDPAGKTLLTEIRSMRFRPQDGGQWLLVLDLQLSAKEPVTLGKTPFGILGVRMAKTIGVHDGGGTLRNSEGGTDEKELFWKPARWVDYSGPISPQANEGITLFDHPSNPNHPAVFHVRDDGWMGASLTFDGPRTIEPGQPLALRYGLWIHAGVPGRDVIQQQFEAFRQIGPPPPLPMKK